MTEENWIPDKKITSNKRKDYINDKLKIKDVYKLKRKPELRKVSLTGLQHKIRYSATEKALIKSYVDRLQQSGALKDGGLFISGATPSDAFIDVVKQSLGKGVGLTVDGIQIEPHTSVERRKVGWTDNKHTDADMNIQDTENNEQTKQGGPSNS